MQMRVEASKHKTNPYRLIFTGRPEIEVVSAAFTEHAHNLESRGNPSSVSKFDRAISTWPSDKKEMRIIAPDITTVTEKLFDLYARTPDVLDTMADLIHTVADDSQLEIRMGGVQWRYNLGNRALALAELVELNFSEFEGLEAPEIDFEAEFAPILRNKK